MKSPQEDPTEPYSDVFGPKSDGPAELVEGEGSEGQEGTGAPVLFTGPPLPVRLGEKFAWAREAPLPPPPRRDLSAPRGPVDPDADTPVFALVRWTPTESVLERDPYHDGSSWTPTPEALGHPPPSGGLMPNEAHRLNDIRHGLLDWIARCHNREALEFVSLKRLEDLVEAIALFSAHPNIVERNLPNIVNAKAKLRGLSLSVPEFVSVASMAFNEHFVDRVYRLRMEEVLCAVEQVLAFIDTGELTEMADEDAYLRSSFVEKVKDVLTQMHQACELLKSREMQSAPHYRSNPEERERREELREVLGLESWEDAKNEELGILAYDILLRRVQGFAKKACEINPENFNPDFVKGLAEEQNLILKLLLMYMDQYIVEPSVPLYTEIQHPTYGAFRPVDVLILREDRRMRMLNFALGKVVQFIQVRDLIKMVDDILLDRGLFLKN